MPKTTTLQRRIWFKRQGRSKKAITTPPVDTAPEPRPLRLTRLMALVIRYQQLIDEGHVANRADLSQVAGVSRGRLTQLMNLLLLAPDIQEEILFLPLTEATQDPICDRDLRPMVAEANWEKQRHLWKQLLKARF